MESTRTKLKLGGALAKKALLCFCAFLLCLLSVVPEKFFPSRPVRQRILFLDDGLLDFDRVQDYPPDSGTEGMFGSLLDYLNMMGFSTERTKGPFTEEKLSSADILVVINSFHEWTPEELRLVNNWVRSGGALLVLGDHTDLGGMTKSLNPLLSQFGATLNFDTGEVPKPILRHGWRLSYRSFLLPAHYYSQIYWGTGGTLTVRLPFEPMLEGAYAFGDIGDYSNNSNFGNRSYDAGEKAGDITLAAVAEPGRGKVIACADTSPFLNGTIHLSFYPFVYNLFRWLQTRSALPSPYLLRWISSLLLVLLVIYSWRSGGTATLRFVLIATVLGLFAARYVANQPFEPARQDLPLAVLDLSHLPKWATDPFQRHSVDGMATVLLRSGYLPVTMWEFDP